MPDSTCKTALRLTLILSLVYVIAAAVLIPAFDATPERIRQNGAMIAELPTPSHSPAYLLWGVWQRFDTFWYRHVAEHGYDRPETVVFYPLYPLAIKAASLFALPTDAGAILIARIATFFLLWGLLRLWRMDLNEQESKRALALFLVWPMSFILFGGYAEPFLIAFTVWAIWFARNDRWLPAVLCAILACLSRAVGVVVLAPLVWIAWRQGLARKHAVLIVALLGPVLFPLFLKLNGLMQASQAYPLYWRTTMALPWVTIIDAFRFWSTDIGWFVGMNAVSVVLVFGIALARPVRWEYFWYALGTLCFILLANARPPLHSYVRYALPVFPAFASAGRVLRAPAAMGLLWAALFLINLILLYAFWDWFFLV